MKIGIAGITGRVGHLLVEAVRDEGVELSLGVTRDKEKAQRDPQLAGVTFTTNMEKCAEDSSVVIDFTHAQTLQDHAQAMVRARTPWVLGTTGANEQQKEVIKGAARHIPIVHAANFSPGIVLMNRLVEIMGRALPAPQYDAEIVEMHHRQKVDAPSGTALKLGDAVARGRDVRLEDVKESGRDGHTGPRGNDAIGFAALRGGQIVGEHSVLFTSADEQLTLTHRAFDRKLFAKGAVQAARWVMDKQPGLYDMEAVLGLTDL